MLTTYLILFSILFVLVLIFWIHRISKKRSETLKIFAETNNLQFISKDDGSLLTTLEKFNLFKHGHSKRISNILIGTFHSFPLTVFDYRYTTGSGKSSRTCVQTVMLVNSTKIDLPEFIMRPENVFHKIGKAFGYKDINFDLHPSFSKNYLLKGKDEDAVRRKFPERALIYFDDHKGIYMEGDKSILLHYRLSKRSSQKDLNSYFESGVEIMKLFLR